MDKLKDSDMYLIIVESSEQLSVFLREYRKKRKVKVKDICKYAKTSNNQIINIEERKNSYSIKYLFIYSECCDFRCYIGSKWIKTQTDVINIFETKRTENNLRIQEIQQSGVNYQFYKKIINGEASLQIDTALKLLNFFDMQLVIAA